MNPLLTHKPPPDFKIPIATKIDDEVQSGYLRPLDDKEPCQSYMVWLNGKWLGTIHHFNSKWHFDNEKYRNLVEEWGEAVRLWYQ